MKAVPSAGGVQMTVGTEPPQDAGSA
jgi:hypothetical protein